MVCDTMGVLPPQTQKHCQCCCGTRHSVIYLLNTYTYVEESPLVHKLKRGVKRMPRSHK